MNAIARKVLTAGCTLALAVSGFEAVANAEVAHDADAVKVAAQEVGPVFHNSVIEKGRISNLRFTDPRSVGGIQDSSFYIDLRSEGDAIQWDEANTSLETYQDGAATVVEMRLHDAAREVNVLRVYRIEDNEVQVRVEVENLRDRAAFIQADLTHQINSGDALRGAYQDGVFTVAPEQGGYETTISFSNPTSSGAAAAFQGTTSRGEVGYVDGAGARFQRGRWFERIGAGETLVASSHISVRTQESAVDSDGDGLPDLWERQGVTLSDGTELALHTWGADPNKPDIFLQLNWMRSEWEQLGCAEAGADAAACANANIRSYRPNREILQQLVDRFNEHGVNLHIDAGQYYSNINNYDQRHGGQTADYQRYYFEGVNSGLKLMNNIDSILGDRSAVFRVGVIGDQMNPGHWGTGLALVADNSFYVARHERMTTDEQLRNTIMHELGHTLGLNHNGSMKFAAQVPQSDYLPNYYSVMNYLYQFTHFDYSDEEAVSGGPLPDACKRPGVNCYEGEYRVPADWDNLLINAGHIGKGAVSIGVNEREVDTVALEAADHAAAAADAANAQALVALVGEPVLKQGRNNLQFEIQNPGIDVTDYEIEVVYPGGRQQGVATLPGAFSGANVARMDVPVELAQVRSTSLPVDVKVINNAGQVAFEQRFDIAAERDQDADSDAMKGAERLPLPAGDADDGSGKQDAAPAGQDEGSAEEQPAGNGEHQVDPAGNGQQSTVGEDGPNIAAIVAPIVVLLLLIGGGAAAAVLGGMR